MAAVAETAKVAVFPRMKTTVTRAGSRGNRPVAARGRARGNARENAREKGIPSGYEGRRGHAWARGLPFPAPGDIFFH